ncbi:iron permease FTR1 [Cutaneotrichosporon oleaginosum]|uniref:Iron permease FTR1 n=1 Tax=Cutaneotrichosporon oleaginosum TaxID=879819 RepID=A0A0J0XPR7_9TREE|nr:iron permease FTR1 [Cutaneotrichosporon oleaginosum]KLT43121.1 iron permease FTR1 [Cutaneotrichosporon oleaginosum]TXT10048.1 hypothetical protein COLE_03982 [Cutaneotrichosporon oleaginosum]
MGNNVFNVPIFFIVFREVIEAAIIVSVLLSFVEQLMNSGRLSPTERIDEAVGPDDGPHNEKVKRIVKRMRYQIWAGTFVGFFIALCIGAAFIAVFYTKLSDLWSKSEQLWEGVFSLIASILIFLMGIAFLKMDRSRIKWRYKLAAAFDHKSAKMMAESGQGPAYKKPSWTAKWSLFLLPLITLLREGLEAVVFVGGVSLGIPATSIPLPVVVGLIAGAIVGYLIYKTGSSTTLHWFLIISTTILFLIGAGLFSKAIGFFQYYKFAKAVGGDVAESGDGPGSYDVHGNVWHITFGNPETGSPTTNGGWQIFNAIFGWNNNASLGTILGYCFYWIAVMAALIYYKWTEGRVTCGGRVKSAAAKRLEARREERLAAANAYDAGVYESKHDGDSATQGSGTPPEEKNKRDLTV